MIVCLFLWLPFPCQAVLVPARQIVSGCDARLLNYLARHDMVPRGRVVPCYGPCLEAGPRAVPKKAWPESQLYLDPFHLYIQGQGPWAMPAIAGIYIDPFHLYIQGQGPRPILGRKVTGWNPEMQRGGRSREERGKKAKKDCT